jgi:Tol biopolymer transport system component
MVCGAACLLFGAIAAVAGTYILMKPTAGPSLYFPVSLPRNQMLNQDRSEIALSPDGRRLVYVGGVGETTRLFLSEVGKNVVTELQETKGARLPFFSPDSRRIGFFADGKLNTLFLKGGRPHPLCDAPNYAGGSWGYDNTIFFSPTWRGGLWQKPTDERVAKEITTPDPNNGEFGHWWPEVLPGAKAVLFTIWKTTLNDAQVAVLTLKTGKIEILINGATHARYASTGHLLYAQSGTLMAAPFNLNKLKVGEPHFVVAEGLKQRPSCGYAPFCFSKDCGVLYYVRGGEWLAKRQFVWVNRETRAVEPLSLELGAYSNPCLSPFPDGSRFAFTKFDRSVFNIWVYDFVSKIPQRLTFESSNFLPFWTPDSSKLTFTTYREGPFSVYWKPADGSSAEKPLVTGILDREAFSWSPDGKKLLFVETDPCTGEDIWIYSIEDGNTTRPLLYRSSNEREAVFSPDGDWIAYVSEEEKDRPEVYVTPYPKLAPKKISTDGGCQPLWSQDSNELFYRSGDKMMAATIETEPDFRVTSRVLFEGQYLTGMYRNYDVSKDGQRFLMIKEDEAQSAAAQLMFVFKKRLVPTGKD